MAIDKPLKPKRRTVTGGLNPSAKPPTDAVRPPPPKPQAVAAPPKSPKSEK